MLYFNISHKLCSEKQFVNENLMAHLAIKQEQAIFDNQYKTLQLKPGGKALKNICKLTAADKDTCFVFACVQNLEQASDASRMLILNWRIGSLEKFIASEK